MRMLSGGGGAWLCALIASLGESCPPRLNLSMLLACTALCSWFTDLISNCFTNLTTNWFTDLITN